MKLNDIHIRDPFILFYDGMYYMYGTRGKGCWYECAGFDVYKSDDLENWSGPTKVFEANDSFWGTIQFWAPEVHEYKGKFYMLASFKAEGKCRATHILVSDAPDQMFVPLSDEPITPSNWECLDGTLYISKKGEPYVVFCHEWLQVTDGEICALKLTDDLKNSIGEPKVLFRGSSPSWAKACSEGQYITDGPFLYRDEKDELYLIWSTVCGEYVEAFAVSSNGEIDGEWIHSNNLIFEKDGGHGMIFKSAKGDLKFIMHAPNINPNERPQLFDIDILNGNISLKLK